MEVNNNTLNDGKPMDEKCEPSLSCDLNRSQMEGRKEMVNPLQQQATCYTWPKPRQQANARERCRTHR